MIRRVCRAALLAVMLAGTAGAGAAEKPALVSPRLDTGWWVVVGADQANGDSPAHRRYVAAAARCGFDLFNDLSGKFQGFAGGTTYTVYVNGAYATRAEADAAAAQMRTCLPAAYVKYGRYRGE